MLTLKQSRRLQSLIIGALAWAIAAVIFFPIFWMVLTDTPRTAAASWVPTTPGARGSNRERGRPRVPPPKPKGAENP